MIHAFNRMYLDDYKGYFVIGYNSRVVVGASVMYDHIIEKNYLLQKIPTKIHLWIN